MYVHIIGLCAGLDMMEITIPKEDGANQARQTDRKRFNAKVKHWWSECVHAVINCFHSCDLYRCVNLSS